MLRHLVGLLRGNMGFVCSDPGADASRRDVRNPPGDRLPQGQTALPVFTAAGEANKTRVDPIAHLGQEPGAICA
jgi:hypothetical protein